VVVVCDTTPINYLLQIDAVHLLPALYERICLPAAVVRELLHPKAPPVVGAWAASPPEWVFVEPDLPITSPEVAALHEGEAQAITVFEALQADFLLTDDLRARRLAEGRGIRAITTLLVLDAAAGRGWIQFAPVAAKLLKTNFRVDSFLIDQLIAKHSGR
jgi:predicted nucleic acid-binding protein